MGKSWLPDSDSALLAWSLNFKTRLSAAGPSYGVSTSQASNYADSHDLYAQALQLANDSITRTKPIITDKDAKRTALKDYARQLAKVVYGFPGISNMQLDELELTVRKQPSPINPPVVSPGMDIISVTGRTMKLTIHDSASSTKRGKPAGSVAAWVYTFIGDDYPADPFLWDFNGASTKSKYEIAFASDLANGTRVWVTAAWVNAKGETGPIATPISTNLQGGGSSSMEMKIAA